MLTMRVGTFTRGERLPNLVGTRHQWVLPTKVTHVKREKLCIVYTKTARVGHCAGSPSTCPIRTVCTRHERNVGIGLRRLNLRRATVRGGATSKAVFDPSDPQVRQLLWQHVWPPFWPNSISALSIITGVNVTSYVTCGTPWWRGQPRFVGVGIRHDCFPADPVVEEQVQDAGPDGTVQMGTEN